MIRLPHHYRLLLLCAALVWQGAGSRNYAGEPVVKTHAVNVLWIGNSYTENGRLSDQVTRMVNEGASPLRMTSDQSVHGGKNFKFHYEETAVTAKIRSGNFDYVVLQNQSLSTLSEETREQMRKYTARFVRVIRASGAEPVLYCTWARAHQPAMQETITQTYRELADAHSAVLSPAGAAWEASLRARPDLQVHAVDRSHPNANGVYLTACVFYAVFTGESPEGHPVRTVDINRRDRDSGKRLSEVMNVTLDDATASFLQQTAWKTVRRFAVEAGERAN